MSQRTRGYSTRHSPPERCSALGGDTWSSWLQEVGQHVVPAPARQAELPPAVVVGGLAAHVDHGVDGRAAADHLAARIGDGAAAEARLRLGPVHPVGARIADGEEVADRDVEPDPVVLPARLEQQDAAWPDRPKAGWPARSRPSRRPRRCSRTRLRRTARLGHVADRTNRRSTGFKWRVGRIGRLRSRVASARRDHHDLDCVVGRGPGSPRPWRAQACCPARPSRPRRRSSRRRS